MNEIRILGKTDAPSMADLMVNAYPGFDIGENSRSHTENWVRAILDRGAEDFMAGTFDAYGKQIAGVRVLTGPINVRMKEKKAIGLGALCVDLLHKKEKVALNLLIWAFNEGRKNGAALAVLDPFDIGFYKKMGCGLGAMFHQFWIPPERFPSHGDKRLLRELTLKDLREIKIYYDRYFKNHSGVIKLKDYEIVDILKNCKVVLGCYQENHLTGIMCIRFERSGFEYLFKTNMVVEEMLFDDGKTLLAFSTFINQQSDQAGFVRLRSQHRNTEFFFDNPGSDDNSTFSTRKIEIHRTGNGMMYRILDLGKLLDTLELPKWIENDFVLKLEVKDNLMEVNNGAWYIYNMEGKSTVTREERDFSVGIKIEVDDLASLLMGSVSLFALVQMGRTELDRPDYLKDLDQVFYYPELPICLSRF